MSLGKTNQGSSQSFDPELKGLLTSTFRTGQALSQTPFQPYNFATVAPLAPTQLEGMNLAAETARARVGGADLQSAINATRAGATATPMNVTADTVAAPTTAPTVGTVAPVGVSNIASGGVMAQNIGPLSTVAPQNVTAQNVAAQSLANTDLSPYQNQFTTAVIDAALGDLERSRQMAQNQNAARAVAAGAYGGDRQAVLEGQTNEAFARQAANTAANLRQQGFESAARRAEADVGRAQGAGLQSAQLAQQAALANQQAGLTAGTQNLQADLARQQANQRAALQAGLDTAGRAQQASTQQAQLGLQSGLAAQSENSRRALANQQAALQTAALASSVGQGNQDAALRAALANQNAQLQGAAQRMQSANQLANLAQTQRALEFADAQALTDVGTAQRAAAQELLSDRLRRFEEERDFPIRMFDVLRAGAGVLPNPLTSSSRGRTTNIGIGS